MQKINVLRGSIAGTLVVMVLTGCTTPNPPPVPVAEKGPDEFDRLVAMPGSGSDQERQKATRRLNTLAFRDPRMLKRLLEYPVDDLQIHKRLQKITNHSKISMNSLPRCEKGTGKLIVSDYFWGAKFERENLTIQGFHYFSGDQLVGSFQTAFTRDRFGKEGGVQSFEENYFIPLPPEGVTRVLYSRRTWFIDGKGENHWTETHEKDLEDRFASVEDGWDSHLVPLFRGVIDSDVESYMDAHGLPYAQGFRRTVFLKVK